MAWLRRRFLTEKKNAHNLKAHNVGTVSFIILSFLKLDIMNEFSFIFQDYNYLRHVVHYYGHGIFTLLSQIDVSLCSLNEGSNMSCDKISSSLNFRVILI